MQDIVYKLNGPHFGPNGTTYEYVGVNSEEELKLRLKEGWFDTLDEAVNGKPKKEAPAKEEGAPSRETVKAKADDLGIEYAKNIGTKKLQKLVEDKLNVMD